MNGLFRLSPVNRSTRNPLPAFLLVTLGVAHAVSAQSVTPRPAAPGETAIELSPFIVSSAKDSGYVAASSLAGTRIRTDLKDLANPITVVTQEFMRDVNATNPVDLLVYTANTEAGGVGGNYSGASIGSPALFTGVTRQPQNNNRVRGLARADLTRDYFPTTLVFDSYNTSRVEINRGPNATLFGLGSPGGIINNQTIRPLLKNTASAEFNYGSFGTTRSVLDVDRVLIPGRLGVRVAALNEKERFQQDYANERDRRMFAALHFAPFKDGALRASFEKGSIDANRPRSDAPRDNLTRWWQAPFNKLTHSPATAEFNTINRDLLRAPGEWFAQPAVVYESNAASAPARLMLAWNTLVGVPRAPGGSPALGFQANMVSITKGDQWYASPTAAATGIKHGSFYADDAISDFSIFDWRNELLDGPNKKEWEDFHVGNVSYDHNWKHPLGSIGIEAAYSRESLTRSFFDMFPGGRGYNLNIDLNTTLPWGAINPNFGRPFVASDNVRSTNNSLRETSRVTTYLELDFVRHTERFKWLGRHNLTGYANRYLLDEQSYSGSNSSDVGWTSTLRASVNPVTARDDINSPDGLVRTVVYIGPNLAGLNSPQGIRLQGIKSDLTPSTATGWYWDQAARAFATRPVQIANVINDDVFARTTTGASLTRQEIDSEALIYQVRPFAKEWIVGTIGWRRDRVQDFRNNGGQDVRDQFNFIDRNSPNFRLPDKPGSIFEESIWSQGVVVHKPPFLRLAPSVNASVHYSRSQNFQPADTRVDMFGRTIAPPDGTTEDRGFSLSFFDGKLQSRFNWYETASARASLGYEGFLIETDARIVRYNTPAALAAVGWSGPPQFLKTLINWQEVQTPSQPSGVNVTFQRPGNLSDTQSTVSKGFEFESTYNPTNRWRIAFNASQQKANRANIAPVAREYLALRVAEWTTGATGNLLADESGQPVKTRVYDTLLNSLNSTLSREGQKVSELRQWRLNLVTNYTFARTSMLRGWNAGGAARWQDKVAIGYPIIAVPGGGGRTIEVPNLARPYYGPAEIKYDGWVGYTTKLWRNTVQWKIQLNLRNLLGEDELVPVMAQPDGRIAAWVAPQGRVFNLQSSFEF